MMQPSGLLSKPICYHNSKDVEREFNGYELAPGLVLGRLGSPNRNDGIENSGAPTVNESSFEVLATSVDQEST